MQCDGIDFDDSCENLATQKCIICGNFYCDKCSEKHKVQYDNKEGLSPTEMIEL